MYRYLLLLPFVLMLTACEQTPAGQTASAAPSIYVGAPVKEQYDLPPCDSEGCAVRVKMSFPNLDTTQLGLAVANSWLKERLFRVYDDDVKAKSVQDVFAFMRAEYTDAAKADADMMGHWYIEREGKVLWASDSVVSVYFRDDSYAGGAHPNTTVLLASFWRTSGRELSLKALVVPGKEQELARVAEAAFRDEREIPADSSLVEQGFIFFEENGFFVSEKVALTEQGLLVRYNAYDAGSYAMGPTEFVLSYDVLKGILKPEYLPAQ